MLRSWSFFSWKCFFLVIFFSRNRPESIFRGNLFPWNSFKKSIPREYICTKRMKIFLVEKNFANFAFYPWKNPIMKISPVKVNGIWHDWVTRFFDFSFWSSVNVIITKSRKFQEHRYVLRFLISGGYDISSNIFFAEVPRKWILET